MKMFEFFKLNFYLFSGKIVLEIKFLHKNVRQFDNFEVFLSVFWDVNKSIKTCLKNILLLPTLFNRNFRITVEHELTFKNIPSQLMLEIIVVIITISNTSGTLYKFLTLFRMGFFRAAHRWGGGRGGGAKKPSFSKTCYTYPKIMKTWHSYTFQKIYESRGRSLEFGWHQHFFTRNQQILLYQKMKI